MQRSLALNAISSAAVIAVLSLAGCDNYPGYPHNETRTLNSDNHKSGNGYYGGVTGQDASNESPGGPSSTAPLNTTRSADAVPAMPQPGMADTGTYGNNSAAGSNAGRTSNNGTAGTQDGGSH
jgi:hypothetical protein